MSVPRFSVEEYTPHGYKYGLALRLLEDVVPRILSINNPLTNRIATANAWFIYLNDASPGLCREICGTNFNKDHKGWGEEELEKIAEALARYASMLLKSVIQEHGQGTLLRPPKPP